MKKDLNIMEHGDKPIFKVGRFDGNLNFTESPSEFRQLGENEGRVGYCQAAKERKEPVFEIGTYENNQEFRAQTC